MPALELLPLDCSGRRQKGSRIFIFVVGVIPFVVLDTNGGVCARGSKSNAGKMDRTWSNSSWLETWQTILNLQREMNQLCFSRLSAKMRSLTLLGFLWLLTRRLSKCEYICLYGSDCQNWFCAFSFYPKKICISPHVCLSLSHCTNVNCRKFELECIAMTATMLNADSQACGSLTSGGTESILMAVKTYRWDKSKGFIWKWGSFLFFFPPQT